MFETVEELARVVARLLQDDVDRVATDELGPRIGVLSALRSAVDATLTATAAEALARGVPETCCDGGVSEHSWLAEWQAEGTGQARQLLGRVRAVAQLPRVREAWKSGRVCTASVSAACAAVHRLPAQVLPAVDVLLAETAQHVLPEDLTKVVHRLVHTIDPDGSAKRGQDLADGQRATLDQYGDGSWCLNGGFAPAEGALLDAGLAAFMTPNGEGDRRTRAQRRADALIEMARRCLADPEGPGADGVRPTVVLLTHEDGDQPAETADGTVLDHGAAQALGCDAHTHRLAHRRRPGTAPGGVLPLALGRASRVATRAQVLALIARDRGCVDPRAPAGRRGPRLTTYGSGTPTTAPPTWSTWPCCAGSTTPGCTGGASTCTRPCDRGRRGRSSRTRRLWSCCAAPSPRPSQGHPQTVERFHLISASRKVSMSPSSTAAVLPVSTLVRRSFTIWYGWST